MRLIPLSFLIFVSMLPAALPGAEESPERAWEAADRQYRASFYYSAALSADLRGLHSEALVLLRRASQADPGSVFLLKELAEGLELAEEGPESRDALKKALDLAPSDAELRQKLARAYVRDGDMDSARKLFLDPQGRDPKDAPSLKALAAMDMAENKWDQAAGRLQRLLELSPQALDEREMYAGVLVKQEKKDEAVQEYEGILKEDPARSESAYRLSHLYESMGKGELAVSTLRRALLASPDSSMLEDALARCLYGQKNYPQAEEAFSKLLEENAQDGESLLYRGMTRLQSKKYKEAQSDFLALGALEQGNPSQLYGLGLAQLWQDKSADAEESFKKLLAAYPKAVPGYTQLAFIYDRTSRTAKAVEILEKGVKENPDSSELYLLLGSAQMDAGDMKKAESVFLSGIKAAAGRSDSALRFQLAVLYDKDGKFPKAEEALNKIIEDEPKNAQALNYLGYSYVDRGLKLAQAEALILRALAVEPQNRYYQDSLGWAYYKEGRLQDAKAALLQAVKIEDPGREEAIVFEHLAQVYEKLGDAKNARANYDKASQLKSATPHAP